MEDYDECMYAPTARSVTRARRRAVEVVEKWGCAEVAGDVGLLVSELATNAVRHGRVAGRLFQVEVTRSVAAVRVAVTDALGERRPEKVGRPDGEEESGRGLHIVAEVAARWDVEELVVGKTVWAELAL